MSSYISEKIFALQVEKQKETEFDDRNCLVILVTIVLNTIQHNELIIFNSHFLNLSYQSYRETFKVYVFDIIYHGKTSSSTSNH